MVKLRRATQPAFAEMASLRLRAAWLYYNQGMTQAQVAEHLNVSRSTVIRMLDEAMKRHEVRIWINEGVDGCVDLALKLEQALGLDEAIVAPQPPVMSADALATNVGLALGQFLSEAIPDNATVGVGWGRTMSASLASFHPPRRENCRIVSLLGGVVEVQGSNPMDYSWRLASQLGAECFLFSAPLLVDSIETKRTLIEKCGLDTIYRLAEQLDIAIISCGDIGPHSTSLSERFLRHGELEELIALGCVCDTMFNFLDRTGHSVPHALNGRAMSVDLDTIRKAGHIVLVSGGAARAEAIIATIRRTGCHTLITDESAARALLALCAD